MRFEGLKLLPGAPLQLQFKHTPDLRERSVLVGYVKNKAVIVSTPLVNGGARPVKIGEQVNLRLFSNECNSAIAFSSQVIHVTLSPLPMLHLEYPQEIATGEVRKAVRVQTDLIATIKLDGNSYACNIVDLSTSGCRIETSQPLGPPDRQLVMLTKLVAAETPRIIQINCTIKAVIRDEPPYIYGLSFDVLSEEVKLVLHAYVYFQLRQ